MKCVHETPSQKCSIANKINITSYDEVMFDDEHDCLACDETYELCKYYKKESINE